MTTEAGGADDPGTIACGRELHILRSDYAAERAAREAAEQREVIARGAHRVALNELAAMRAQCEGLAKDAARWGFFRLAATETDGTKRALIARSAFVPGDADALDAAIDRALVSGSAGGEANSG